MRSMIDLPINMDVNYVRRHKLQLAHFFQYFSTQVDRRLEEPLLSYNLQPQQFDEVGTLWIEKTQLDNKSLRLVQAIEDAYMSMAFFSSYRNGSLGSRGHVYYTSAIIDDDPARMLLRFINHLATSVQLLQEWYPHYETRWEFGIYALLDDIRYKLLLLEDWHPEVVDKEWEPLASAVTLYYDYLQGALPAGAVVDAFCERLHAAIFFSLKNSNQGKLRHYKEADHPWQNLVFRDTLMQQMQGIDVDTIIGMRFGGSELPHLLARYFGRAHITKVRTSQYSQQKSALALDPSVCRQKTVLIVDDNTLTGRTLETLVGLLRKYETQAAYFGCVTYSGMKRYHQMLMDNHGVINPEVLLRSCTIGESQYTKITNNRSYKNQNGVFDKVKARLQKRMSGTYIEYEL